MLLLLGVNSASSATLAVSSASQSSPPPTLDDLEAAVGFFSGVRGGFLSNPATGAVFGLQDH